MVECVYFVCHVEKAFFTSIILNIPHDVILFTYTNVAGLYIYSVNFLFVLAGEMGLVLLY